MRFFDNFKILLKLAIPVGVLVAVAAGLVLLASASLTRRKRSVKAALWL